MKLTFAFVATLVAQASALAVVQRNTLEARSCPDPAKAVPFLRAVDTKDVDHFYTTSTTEFQNAINSGKYAADSIAGKIFTAQEPGTVPFYRLYSAEFTDHFYTKDANERDLAVNVLGYASEGIAGYVYPDASCGGSAFKQLLLNAPTDHFYTYLDFEVALAEKEGYQYEKVAAYIIPNA